MVTTPNVVEDAREIQYQGTSPPRWSWLAVGLVLGAGLTTLLLGVDADEPATTTLALRTEEVTPEQGGIGDQVDGFPDGLLAAARSDGRSLQLLVWPLRGEPYLRTIPVGVSSPPGPTSFDVSGRHIAALVPVVDDDAGVLYAGVPENASIIATDVTGYAWHDSDPFRLSYTTYVDDELLLWAVGHNRSQPEMITRSVGIQGHVAAWGPWGYAVQDEVRDSVVLFTDNGEIKDIHPGRVLDSYSTGWLAIENEGVSLLSSGGGARGLDGGTLEDVLAGRFSNDGTKLALLTSEHVLVVSLEDASELIESGGRPGVTQLTWSSDGRFVLYPGRRGIWVVDTRDGEVQEVLPARILTGLAVIPLGSS